MAKHYGVAVVPARPAKPRDKAKVESAVLVVQRWVLARLRNRRFWSLGELDQAISELIDELNRRPFKKLEGSRRSAFESLDRPALQPLPARRYELGTWTRAKVHIRLPHRFRSPLLQRPGGAGCPSGPRRWPGRHRSTRTATEPAARAPGTAHKPRCLWLARDSRKYQGRMLAAFKKPA
jgi:hypothetical protein